MASVAEGVFFNVGYIYVLLSWNYLIKELQEWQSLGMAIEQARVV